MPFDSANFDDLSVFTPGLMGLKKLSQLPRKEMPKGFAWYFNNYKLDISDDIISNGYKAMVDAKCNMSGCAIGLAANIWPETKDMLVNRGVWLADAKKVTKYFGITNQEANFIFFSTLEYKTDNVTPAMVADKIDALLKDKYGIA